MEVIPTIGYNSPVIRGGIVAGRGLGETVFTGLIEHVGSVLEVLSLPAGKQLRIEIGPLGDGLRSGDSLAVDGVCLTAVSARQQSAVFDVVGTTLARTTLGGLAKGSLVNLERPITLQGRLGGHLVAGHVDGLASFQRWSHESDGRIAHFETDPELTELMIPQGSVAVNGVSLTVAGLSAGRFSVALIPTTLGRTNLGQLKVVQKVNIETDLIGKYVAKLLASGKDNRVTMEKLREHGFA